MRFSERIRNYDIFGAQVGLTYKGDSEFKTTCGGVVTIILVFLLTMDGVVDVYNTLLNR